MARKRRSNRRTDSKPRACDLVKLRVRDVSHGDCISARAIVMQQKTQRPVQFEITEPTREAVSAWIQTAGLRSDDFLFPSRVHASPHISTRLYARILDTWVREVGLDPLESTVRYLGIEVDDALEMAEHTEI